MHFGAEFIRELAEQISQRLEATLLTLLQMSALMVEIDLMLTFIKALAVSACAQALSA